MSFLLNTSIICQWIHWNNIIAATDGGMIMFQTNKNIGIDF